MPTKETIEDALLRLYTENKILWGEYCYMYKLLEEKINVVAGNIQKQCMALSDMHGDE